MAGGGTTTSTVINERIPEEFMPYFERLMTRTESQTQAPYTPYSGQRIAGQSGDIIASNQAVRDIASGGMPQTQAAMGTLGGIGQQAQGMAGDDGYGFSQFDFSPTETFTAENVGQYMSPYMQDVVNQQKTSALEDYQIAKQLRNAEAVKAGAFGGSRQGVQEGLAERDLLSRTNQIQKQGLQDSFTQAQQMFEADRAAKAAKEAAQAGELGRVQGSQAAENLAQRNFDLQALGFSADQAKQVAALEQQARAGDIQAAQLLEAVGKSNQAYQQAGLDTAYQDFLRQQNYPTEQLQLYSNILQGLPIANAGTSETQVPTNPLKDLLGAGISALSLYKGLGS